MTTCLRKLKIYGDLAEHLEVKEIEIDVATVAKSIQCLLAYYPKAESYMINRNYFQCSLFHLYLVDFLPILSPYPVLHLQKGS